MLAVKRVDVVAAPDGAELARAERPRKGDRAEHVLDDLGVVVGARRRGAAPRPVQEKRSAPRPSTPASSSRRSSSAASASRTWNWTVRADGDARPDRRSSRPAARAEHAAHQEVAAAELGLVLVDDDPELQPVREQAAGRRRAAPLATSASRSSDGLPAELPHDVVLRVGDDVRAGRPAGSPATRRPARSARRASSTPTAPSCSSSPSSASRFPPGPAAADASPPITWSPGRSSASRVEERLDREGERIGEEQQRVPGSGVVIAPVPGSSGGHPDDRRPVGRAHDPQRDRRRRHRPDTRPTTESAGIVLGLDRAADDRSRGHADERRAGSSRSSQHLGHVVERARRSAVTRRARAGPAARRRAARAGYPTTSPTACAGIGCCESAAAYRFTSSRLRKTSSPASHTPTTSRSRRSSATRSARPPTPTATSRSRPDDPGRGLVAIVERAGETHERCHVADRSVHRERRAGERVRSPRYAAPSRSVT